MIDDKIAQMLNMQEEINARIHPQWRQKNFPWYRAIWIECAELLGYCNYKWWQHSEPQWHHIHLEIVDILHFGMGDLLVRHTHPAIIERIKKAFTEINTDEKDICQAVEQLALIALQKHYFSLSAFYTVTQCAQMNFDQIYQNYLGKNVLNHFRQNHGYTQGCYQKIWGGREDNEHLFELTQTLQVSPAEFSDRLYQALKERYSSLCHDS